MFLTWNAERCTPASNSLSGNVHGGSEHGEHFSESRKIEGFELHSEGNSTTMKRAKSSQRRQHGKSGGSSAQVDFGFGYFYRTLEEHIEAFAAQEGCPYSLAQLAERVAGLLQASALRQPFRNPELVPEMRQNGASAGLRGPLESGEEIHVRARPRRTLSAKARRAIARAQRARWKKWKKAMGRPARKSKSGMGMGDYWQKNFPTPELRAKEMKRRMLLRSKKKAVVAA